MSNPIGLVEHAIAASFAVETGDVSAVNQSKYRPDLYVGLRPQRAPLYEATIAGALTDGTPLSVSKHGSFTNGPATGTEGTGPAATVGFTVTSGPTLTPQSITAQAEITREVWDQVGQPGVASEVARLMTDAFRDVIEDRIATALAAATLTEIELTAAAADDVLEDDLISAMAALDITRGGADMTASIAGGSLFTGMVEARGSDGHRIGVYRAGSVDFAGRTWRPSPAMTSGAAATAYVFRPGSVVTLASAPSIRNVQSRVATVDVLLTGYSVTAVTDAANVRRVVFGEE